MYIHYYNKWMSFTFRNPKPPLRVCFQGVRAITSKESTSKHSMLDFCHVGLSALLARWLVLCFTRRSKSSWKLSSNTTPEARLCHFRNHFAGEKKLGSSPSRSRLMPRQDTDGAAAGEALTASSESGSAALPPSCLTVLAQPVYCRLQAAGRSCCAPKVSCASRRRIPIRGPGEIGSSIGKSLCWQQREPRGRIRAPPRASISEGEKVWGGGQGGVNSWFI